MNQDLIDYNKWRVDVFINYSPESSFRKGQYFMNELYKVRSDIYSQIVGQSIDPFYNDYNIPAALEYCSLHW